MHLSDLRIGAMDGAALVDGRLGIRTDHPAAQALLPAEDGIVAVRLAGARGRGASFRRIARIEQAPDGLYAAERPLLDVAFEDAVPDFASILLHNLGDGSRFTLAADGVRIGSVGVRRSAPDGSWLPGIHAEIAELSVRITHERDGVRIAFEGALRPFAIRGGSEAIVPGARLVGDVLIPRGHFAVWQMYVSSGWNERETAPWEPRPGLAALAVGSYGESFFPGFVEWGQDPAGTLPSGPFVNVNLRAHEMTAQPVARLGRSENGYASGRSALDGPQLVLPLGHADLVRILGARDEAEADYRGAGCGHLDGQTGRSVGECGGPMTQELTALKLRLARQTGSSIRVEGEGRLAPLTEYPARSLGPALRFRFDMPRAWMLARGLPFRRLWEEWSRERPEAMRW